MTLRLLDLEAPLEDVEFPNGTKHVPVPFGPTEYRLWRDLHHLTDDVERGKSLMAIIVACYPTASVEDIDTCTPRMLFAMAAHAGHRIAQVREALKNVVLPAEAGTLLVVSPTTVPDTAASSPKTSGATSARSSRGRSTKTSGTSTNRGRTASRT